MNTYMVERQPERGQYRMHAVPWMVSMRHSMPIIDLSEAEAHIIAFALNAVAEGKELYCALPGEIGAMAYYDGPTEGVAPHG
jgi:hypothetical protein